jgi:outer membrane protein TolC
VRAEKRANPVLTVGGKSERPEAGQDYAQALIVEVNVPFGTRGQAAVNRAAAERSYAEAGAALARTAQELEHQLHTTRAEHALAAQSLELAERQQALSAQGLQLARRAFELGESDLFMLLQARAQALAAERDLQLRRLEQGRAAARLNQALGVIPE